MSQLILTSLIGHLQAAPKVERSGVAVESLLRQGHQAAVQSLQSSRASERTDLRNLAFDSRRDLKTRWQALMVYSQLEGPRAVPDLKKALQSPQWFMRSGALTALHGFDPQQARQWALPVFKQDPALLVRMKAFEILREKPDASTQEVFWEKLQSAQNFHQKRGLWIREDIARELARQPRKSDQSRWVQILHRDELPLQKIAAQALARLTPESDLDGVNLSQLKERFPQVVR